MISLIKWVRRDRYNVVDLLSFGMVAHSATNGDWLWGQLWLGIGIATNIILDNWGRRR